MVEEVVEVDAWVLCAEAELSVMVDIWGVSVRVFGLADGSFVDSCAISNVDSDGCDSKTGLPGFATFFGSFEFCTDSVLNAGSKVDSSLAASCLISSASRLVNWDLLSSALDFGSSCS